MMTTEMVTLAAQQVQKIHKYANIKIVQIKNLYVALLLFYFDHKKPSKRIFQFLFPHSFENEID